MLQRLATLRSTAGSLPDRTATAPLAVSAAAIVLYPFGPHAASYPAAVVAIAAFGLVPLLLPAAAPRVEQPVCPQNWALLLFLFQLVVDPLIVVFAGPYINTLPVLPPGEAINIAILIAAIAFCSYATGMQLAQRRAPAFEPARETQQWTDRPWTVAAIYFALGLIGLFVAFRTPQHLIDYFRNTSGHVGALNQQGQTGASKVASVTLRVFLGFAVIVPLCAWLDRRRSTRRWKLAAVAIPAALLVALVNATFSYNRAAFVAPLLALLGAIGARTLRVRIVPLLACGLVALAFLTAFRAYRNSHYSASQILTSAKARSSLIDHVSLSKEIQIYTAAPQYLGYLLDRIGYGAHPHYGRTLVSSVMFPVPALGAPFRSDSGVLIFNHLIYGPESTDTDQVIPFQGELFLDFAYAGVVLGFLVLGLALHRVQRAFERSGSSLAAFTWMYAGIWLGFLLVGSLSVVSQTALYFFWPVIVLAGLSEWRSRRAARRAALT